MKVGDVVIVRVATSPDSIFRVGRYCKVLAVTDTTATVTTGSATKTLPLKNLEKV